MDQFCSTFANHVETNITGFGNEEEIQTRKSLPVPKEESSERKSWGSLLTKLSDVLFIIGHIGFSWVFLNKIVLDWTGYNLEVAELVICENEEVWVGWRTQGFS
ncbi:hypothetical protein L3X38_005219 [Prunus dulcis]|uniref:Uncharacterized protein n=1 Tax=Prunus dulcis TaxID=3755 RepID=A0AAD4ZQD1_PRUDU|nr:hypothetical protein L3X38_005219 [Prunus dulcis]